MNKKVIALFIGALIALSMVGTASAHDPKPKCTPTATQSEEPSSTPSEEPSQEPTPEPTVTPEPTPEPTATPTGSLVPPIETHIPTITLPPTDTE